QLRATALGRLETRRFDADQLGDRRAAREEKGDGEQQVWIALHFHGVLRCRRQAKAPDAASPVEPASHVRSRPCRALCSGASAHGRVAEPGAYRRRTMADRIRRARARRIALHLLAVHLPALVVSLTVATPLAAQDPPPLGGAGAVAAPADTVKAIIDTMPLRPRKGAQFAIPLASISLPG